MTMLTTVALALILSSPSVPDVRCDRPAPAPVSFHSRGFGFVVEVFPRGSRNNEGPRPVAYTYQVAHPGLSWEVEATRRWMSPLPHETLPQEAVVSAEGHVVTLDDYGTLGGKHALVVFDKSGNQVADYDLSDLMTEAEINETERSDCGIHWRTGARYFFLLDGHPRFYLVLARGLTLEVDLEVDRLTRGADSDFPELAEVMERPFANEEVEVWATSLRFSSITDREPRR